jgi:hypothetical protein
MTTENGTKSAEVIEMPKGKTKGTSSASTTKAAPAPGPAKWSASNSTAQAPTPSPRPAQSGCTWNLQRTYPVQSPDAPTTMIPIMPAAVDPMLADILTWPRPHDSPAEIMFGSWLLRKLNDLGHKPHLRELGCLSVAVPYPEGSPWIGTPDVLFVSHIDTVDSHHHGTMVDTEAGKVVKRKKVSYDTGFSHIILDNDSMVGSCLGADDGVGVWIMLKMIEAKIPGSYLFMRGEEKGCLGANAMIKHVGDKEWLKTHTKCIEFDRPNCWEVITHQSGGTRCASDTFGQALADALNKSDSLFYKTSARGVHTDNYNFRGLIQECVNLGVGYAGQHGYGEVQDYGHAQALLQQVLLIDWAALPVEREAKIEQWQGYTGSRYNSDYSRGSYASGGRGFWSGDDEEEDPPALPFGGSMHHNSKNGPPAHGKKGKGKQPAQKATFPEPDVLEDVDALGEYEDVIDFCENDPGMAAAIIVELAAELRGARVRGDSIINSLRAKKRPKGK